MKKTLLTLSAVALLAGGVAITHAQPWNPGEHHRRGDMAGQGERMMRQMANISEADRAAFLDARLAGVKAGLKLTADQDKLWPAVESAVREALAQRPARQAERGPQASSDPIEQLRRRAHVMTTQADGMRKLADAAQPLYASLSDEQKQRLPRLMNMGRGQHALGDGERHHHVHR